MTTVDRPRVQNAECIRQPKKPAGQNVGRGTRQREGRLTAPMTLCSFVRASSLRCADSGGGSHDPSAL